MDKKQHILNEIKRTAEENGGKPLGRERFFTITGIKQADWHGKPWNNWNGWGDAQKEAGYSPNQLQEAFDQNLLIEKLIKFIRTLERFPVEPELKRESARNPDFPSHKTFTARLGNKKQKLEKIIDFCRKNPNEYQDILNICENLIPVSAFNKDDFSESVEAENHGFVYLMKSGKYYKIGCTNALDRRQYEIGMQLPEKIEPIHSIRTDDPSGIEAYWHTRFKDKRLNGEWFDLASADVRIFKKRKFM